MKNFILLLSIVLLSKVSFGQTANDLYRTGDSLYKAKDYKNAALAYSAGINKQSPNAPINRYRSTAGFWAMANMLDSAFYLLEFITKSPKLTKVDLQRIEYGADYAGIQNDKRWPKILDDLRKQAEKNGYPQEEFVYGRKDGIALTLVQINPKVKSNGKAIVYVISGSWFSSYNGIEVPTEAAEQYLAKGYTVFAVMHGSNPRYAIPDAMNDIKRAVRYVRYNSGKFGIDPARIGITGSSAGGHLSLLVATADEKINSAAPDPVDRVSSRVQAIAVLFPPTDLLNWGGQGNNMANAKELLKATRVWGALNYRTWNEKYSLYEEVTDTTERNKITREISPIYAVSADDPPIFIIHGDADITVPLQQSQSIIAQFIDAGVPNQFVIKKGGKHNGDDMKPEWLGFVDWFDKYLK